MGPPLLFPRVAAPRGRRGLSVENMPFSFGAVFPLSRKKMSFIVVVVFPKKTGGPHLPPHDSPFFGRVSAVSLLSFSHRG